ncbi:GtrA family protein [Apibacter muscae]|uniref:GtrA family protein n=2 Tax=Apibacter muscae TaxID=2509004 RepID=A0A563D8D9_9FLAO|nr:GtrA family protein [Apibacter muscae]TWP26201.1 GtrA family protein [Apibacter muscae]
MITAIKKHKKQIILFFIAGFISAIIEISLMKILSLPQMLPSIFTFENKAHAYPLSNIISTAGGIMSNYFFSIRYVFERGKHSKRKEFALFLLLSIITMLMSWGVFAFFHSFIHEPINIFHIIKVGDIVVCKAAAILLVSVINYIAKKKIVFSN